MCVLRRGHLLAVTDSSVGDKAAALHSAQLRIDLLLLSHRSLSLRPPSLSLFLSLISVVPRSRFSRAAAGSLVSGAAA